MVLNKELLNKKSTDTTANEQQQEQQRRTLDNLCADARMVHRGRDQAMVSFWLAEPDPEQRVRWIEAWIRVPPTFNPPNVEIVERAPVNALDAGERSMLYLIDEFSLNYLRNKKVIVDLSEASQDNVVIPRVTVICISSEPLFHDFVLGEAKRLEASDRNNTTNTMSSSIQEKNLEIKALQQLSLPPTSE